MSTDPQPQTSGGETSRNQSRFSAMFENSKVKQIRNTVSDIATSRIGSSAAFRQKIEQWWSASQTGTVLQFLHSSIKESGVYRLSKGFVSRTVTVDIRETYTLGPVVRWLDLTFLKLDTALDASSVYYLYTRVRRAKSNSDLWTRTISALTPPKRRKTIEDGRSDD